MSKYMFVDTETGGIDPKFSSLLSVGVVIWENGIIIDSKEFFIKQKSYNVTGTALEINKINLLELEKKGISKKEAVMCIVDMIKENFNEEKAAIAGHNIQFDIGFLKQLFEDVDLNFNEYFSHRLIETSSILRFLADSKIIPYGLESSDKAFDFFNIDINNRHSALDDALATVELYEQLMSKIKKRS